MLQSRKLGGQARKLLIRAGDLLVSVLEPFICRRGNGIVGFNCFGARR
jgi:hypothetical protein